MSTDLVSIGMPVHNGEHYLEQAVRSNLDQTYPHFELIIADNASTDRTRELCEAFAQSDRRIRYVRNDANIGAAANYNKVFRMARGDYFRWSNADDVVAPTLLERTLPVLSARSDAVIAFGRTCFIDEAGDQLEIFHDDLDLRHDKASQRYIEFTRKYRLTNIIYGLMRSSAMRRTELMGNGKLPAGDINFLAAMILQGKFISIDDVLFYRRMHEAAFSALKERAQERQFWNASSARIACPRWRSIFADAKAVLRSPLPMREKLALLAFTAKRAYWERQALTRDVISLFSLRA